MNELNRDSAGEVFNRAYGKVETAKRAMIKRKYRNDGLTIDYKAGYIDAMKAVLLWLKEQDDET